MNDEQTSPATQNAQDIHLPDEKLRPAGDLINYLRRYAREKPAVIALGSLGIGVLLGWKLKIW